MDGVGLLFKLLMLLGNLPSSKAPAISTCTAETWKPFCHLPLGLDDRGGTLGALPSPPPALKSHLRFVSAFEIQVLSEPPLHLKMGLSTVPLFWGCWQG